MLAEKDYKILINSYFFDIVSQKFKQLEPPFKLSILENHDIFISDKNDNKYITTYHTFCKSISPEVKKAILKNYRDKIMGEYNCFPWNCYDFYNFDLMLEKGLISKFYLEVDVNKCMYIKI